MQKELLNLEDPLESFTRKELDILAIITRNYDEQNGDFFLKKDEKKAYKKILKKLNLKKNEKVNQEIEDFILDEMGKEYDDDIMQKAVLDFAKKKER